jgi:hypothetical protein
MIPNVRPSRLRRLIDVFPEGPKLGGENLVAPAPESTIAESEHAATHPVARHTRVILRVAYRTAANVFGLFREYRTQPNQPPSMPDCPSNHLLELNYRSPDASLSLKEKLALKLQEIILPFPNITMFRFAHWFYTAGSAFTQSLGNKLLRNVIQAEDFDPRHLEDVNLCNINMILDGIDTTDSFLVEDGWRSTNTTIFIPKPHPNGFKPSKTPHTLDAAEEEGEAFSIKGLRYRSLTHVIRSRFSSPSSREFHFTPFKNIHTRSDGLEERVHGEMYTSKSWLEEHERVQSLHIETLEPCMRERAVVAMMLSSDPTHVSQTGHSRICPVYLWFGNQSKDERQRASEQSCEHIAYLPEVSLSYQK